MTNTVLQTVIQLDDSFYIVVEKWSWDLKEFKETRIRMNKHGEQEEIEIVEDHGYFSTLDRAVNHYIKLKTDMSLTKRVSLKEYVERYEDVADDIRRLLK